jgi:hypothetical protein
MRAKIDVMEREWKNSNFLRLSKQGIEYENESESERGKVGHENEYELTEYQEF